MIENNSDTNQELPVDQPIESTESAPTEAPKEPPYRKKVYDLLSTQTKGFTLSEDAFYKKLDTDGEYGNKLFDFISNNFSNFKKPKDEFITMLQPVPETDGLKKNGEESAAQVGGETTPAGEQAPKEGSKPLNPIELYRKLEEERNKAKEANMPVSAGIGAPGTTTPYDTKKLKDLEFEVANSGYDEGDLKVISQLPEDVLKSKDFSIDKLMELKKTNPSEYNRTINHYTWAGNLAEAMAKRAKTAADPNNPVFNFNATIYPRIEGNFDYNGSRQNNQFLRDQINTFFAEDEPTRKKLLKSLAIDAAANYDGRTKGTDDSVYSDPAFKYMNKNQVLAYHLLQDTDPEEAAQYDKLMLDKATLDGQSKLGYEDVGRKLEVTGITTQIAGIDEAITKIVPNNYSISDEDKAAYDASINTISNLQTKINNYSSKLKEGQLSKDETVEYNQLTSELTSLSSDLKAREPELKAGTGNVGLYRILANEYNQKLTRLQEIADKTNVLSPKEKSDFDSAVSIYNSAVNTAKSISAKQIKLTPEQDQYLQKLYNKRKALSAEYNDIQTGKNQDYANITRFDNTLEAQDVLGIQRHTGVPRFLLKVGEGMDNLLQGTLNLITSPFMDAKDNYRVQLAALGGQKENEFITHLTPENSGTTSGSYVVTKDFQSKIDAIKGSDMSDTDKLKAYRDLKLQHPDAVYFKPSDPKLNFSGSAALYGVTDMAAQLIPFFLTEGGGAALGLAKLGTSGEVINTIQSMILSSYQDKFASKVAEGNPNPEGAAFVETAVEGLFFAGLKTPEAIRNAVNPKTAIGAALEQFTDHEIEQIISHTPIKDSIKGALGASVSMAGAGTGAQIVNAKIEGKDLDPAFMIKQTMYDLAKNILSFSLAGIGSKAVTGGFKPQMNDAVFTAAANPEYVSEVIDSKVQSNELTEAQATEMKANVRRLSQVFEDTEFVDKDGNYLDAKKAQDLFALKLKKLGIEEFLKKDIPEPLKIKAEAELSNITNEVNTIYNTPAPDTSGTTADATVEEDTPHISVGEITNRPAKLDGRLGHIYQDGQTLVFQYENGNERELGNVDKISGDDIRDYGIETVESVVSADDTGNITVRGKAYVNDIADPNKAIVYDNDGNVIAVKLKTEDGQRRTFRGQVAEDIAYQIKLKQITNEHADEFEKFINSNPALQHEIQSGENEVIAKEQADTNNEDVSGQTQGVRPKVQKLFNEPNAGTKVISKKYKADNGITTPDGTPVHKLDIEFSKRLADAYDEMKHDPNNPEVKAAYEALVKETKAQYDAMAKSGVRFEIFEGEGEPYASSEEMINDIRDNNHLFVLSTEKDFGQNKITDEQRNDNPLLKDSGVKDVNGKPLLMNDLFRGVHDYFGHSERGNGFGAVGEENAWDVHARMFTDIARRAMTTETRGQNSWVNFGKHMRNEHGNVRKMGEEGYLGPKDRPFAEQKIGLLPKEFSNIDSIDEDRVNELRGKLNKAREVENADAIKAVAKKLEKRWKKVDKGISVNTENWTSNLKAKVESGQIDQAEYDRAVTAKGYFDPETNEIHLNPAKFTADTPIHEFGHVWFGLLKKFNPELYAKGMELANGVDIPVTKSYKGLSDEAINEEHLVKLIGKEGARILESRSEFKQWVKDVITYIKNALGIKGNWDKLTIEDFIKLGAEDVIGGLGKRAWGNVKFENQLKELNLKKGPFHLQAEDIFSGRTEAPKFKSLPEIAKYLTDFAKKNKIFKKEISSLDDKTVVKGWTDHLRAELDAWDQVNKDYVGFYDHDIPVRLNPELQKFAKKRYGRELSEDEVSLYHLVSSFASPSADPVFDSSKGLEVFDKYMKTGELSAYGDEQATEWETNAKGERYDTGRPKFDENGNKVYKQVAKAYATESLAKFQRVIDHFNGDVKKSVEWIKSIHSYKEMSDVLGTPEKGPKAMKTHEYLSKENGGFGVFAITGVKLGSYVLNRTGEYSTATKDMWYARTMARLSGESLFEAPGKALKSPWDTTKEGVRKRELADKAFQILAKERGSSVADIQQKIWDFEKRLYEKLGAVEKSGYASDGFKKKANELEPTLKLQADDNDLVEQAGQRKKMTEDSEGNYVFFHYSDKNFKKTNPEKFGSNSRATGRDENPGVGMTMFYTSPDVREANVPNNFGVVTTLPKDQVYPFNKDPLDLLPKAEAEFRKQFGEDAAFDKNKQVAFVTKVAAREGYPMTIAEWNIGGKKVLRAQSTESLPVESYSKVKPGTLNQTEFNPKYDGIKPNSQRRDLQLSANDRDFEFVKSSLNEGYTPKEIKKILVEDGYSKDEADELIGSARESLGTSTMNRTVEMERAARGLEMVDKAGAETWGETWSKAKAKVDSGTIRPRNPKNEYDSLTAELLRKPRPISAEENAALLYDRAKLSNERETALQMIEEAQANGDTKLVESLQFDLAVIEQDMDNNDNVVTSAGTEIGRALNARKMLLAQDYSLANMERRLKAAKGGKPLTTEEQKTIKELSAKLKIAQDKIDKYESAQKTDPLVNAVNEAKKTVAKKTVTREVFVAKKESIVGRLKARNNKAGGSGALELSAEDLFSKDDISDIKELFKEYVSAGETDPVNIVANIHDDIKNIFEGVQMRDIRDAISGYGETSKLSQEDLDIAMRDIKSQMRVISSIENVENNIRPEKSGLQRDEPSDEVRRLRQELYDKMKKADFPDVDAESEYKSALDTVKKRLTNQIADLEDQIKTGARRTPNAKIDYDQQANNLVAERDRLKDIVAQIDEQSGYATEKKIAQIENTLKRSIENLQNRIANNELETTKSEAPTSDHIEYLKGIKKLYADQLKQMQEDAGVIEKKKLETYKKSLKNRLADYEERIANKDFSKKTATERALDSEAIKLKKDVEDVKYRFEKEKLKAERANMSKTQAGIEKLLRYRRAVLLSSITTLGKIGMAGTYLLATKPIEEIAGTGLKFLMPGIAKGAAREGYGFNPKAEAKALTQLFQKATLTDLSRVMSGQKGELETAYGKKIVTPEEQEFFGQLHSVIKYIPKQNEVFRSMEHRFEFAAKNGEDISDPVVQSRIISEAIMDGNRTIFMGENAIVDSYKSMVRTLEQKDHQGLANTLKFLLPIIKVPTNYVKTTGEYLAGAVPAARIMMKGIENLSPAEKDAVMRLMKKQSVGLVFLAIGMLNPGNFGGYYTGKRDEKDVKDGEMRFFGVEIPKWMGHAPLIEVMQFGATVRRLLDADKAKGEIPSVTSAIAQAGVDLTKEMPFVKVPEDVLDAADSKGGKWSKAKQFAANTATSLIVPPDVKKLAKGEGPLSGVAKVLGYKGDVDSEGEVNKRRAISFLDQIKVNIPGARETVQLDKEDAQAKARAEITSQIKAGKYYSDISEETKKAANIGKHDIKEFIREAHMDASTKEFKNAQPEKQLKLWSVASQAQREEIAKFLKKKKDFTEIVEKHPELLKEQQYLKAYNNIINR